MGFEDMKTTNVFVLKDTKLLNDYKLKSDSEMDDESAAYLLLREGETRRGGRGDANRLLLR